MADRLRGKSSIVTGAGSGNGQGIALAYGDEGALVACTDLNLASAQATADQINDRGGKAIAIGMDVGSAADCERTVRETVEAFGGLDILVNNAGILVSGTALTLTEADWDRQQRVNSKGPFLMSRAAIPSLIARGGGSIVMLSSLAGLYGIQGSAAYCASKHAVIGLTKCLALDHAGDGIRVNAICPGLIETGMARQIFDAIAPGEPLEEVKAGRAQFYPMGRIGQPSDVAAIAVHFASDEAAWTTGAVYSVDGGFSLTVRS